MLTTEFTKTAQFPSHWQEKDLQEYIAQKLRQRGFQARLEVSANGGRADIITNWQGGSIIEVKKFLDRNSIYQAAGQLGLYGLKNNHKLVVMGFLTTDAKEQASAKNTAMMLVQNPRMSVIFVNLESDWLPSGQIPRIPLPKFNLGWLGKLLIAHPLLIAIALIALGMGYTHTHTDHHSIIKKHRHN